MGNHFHLLIQMFPENSFKDEEIRKRCKAHYGEDFVISDEQIGDYRVKLSSLARYFTDSGIIGTKEFVSENYQRFKDVFMSKREKVPKLVAGLDGVYSLKRLTE